MRATAARGKPFFLRVYVSVCACVSVSLVIISSFLSRRQFSGRVGGHLPDRTGQPTISPSGNGRVTSDRVQSSASVPCIDLPARRKKKHAT